MDDTAYETQVGPWNKASPIGMLNKGFTKAVYDVDGDWKTKKESDDFSGILSQK
jgi:hypothetical protein